MEKEGVYEVTSISAYNRIFDRLYFRFAQAANTSARGFAWDNRNCWYLCRL